MICLLVGRLLNDGSSINEAQTAVASVWSFLSAAIRNLGASEEWGFGGDAATVGISGIDISLGCRASA